MVLPRTTIDIPIGGLGQNVDPKLLPPGSSLEAQNVEFDKHGSVNKRKGYTELTTDILGGGSISACRKIFELNGRLVLIDGSKIYEYSSSLAKWISRGNYIPCRNSVRPIPKFYSSPEADSVVSGNFVWSVSQTMHRYAVSELSSGITVVDDTDFATFSYTSICASSTYVYIAGRESTTVDVQKFSNTDPTSKSSVCTLTSNSNYFDMADLDGSGTCVIVYGTTSGVTVKKFNSSGGILGSTSTTGTMDRKPSIVVDSSQNIWIMFHTAAAGMKVWALNSSLTPLFSAAVPTGLGSVSSTAVGCMIGTSCRWWVGDPTTASDSSYYLTVNTSGTITGPTACTSMGMCPCGYPYKVSDTEVYIPMLFVDSTQRSVFVYKTATDGSLSSGAVARMLPMSVYRTAPQTKSRPINMGTLGIGWMFYSDYSESGNYINVISCFDKSYSPNATIYGSSLLFSGSIVAEYDGERIIENNFLTYPVLTSSGTTGGSLTDGTYTLYAVYKRIDNLGNVVRSSPSLPSTVTLSAGGSSQRIEVLLYWNEASMDPSTVKNDSVVEIYCTTANGTIPYYVKDIQYVSPGWDDAVDSVSTSAAQLYTADNTLEYFAPPQLVSIATKGGRVFGITERGDAYYTHKALYGVSASFSPYLSLSIGKSTDDTNFSVSSIDGTLIVTDTKRIWYVSGDGPAADGSNSDLQDPKLIASDYGCVSGSPMLSSHIGMIYKSARGLSLLDRSLQANPQFGEPVSESLSLTLSTSICVPSESFFLFGHSDGDAYVYDYVANQWAKFTNSTMVSSALVGGTLYWATSAGKVRYRSSAYLDGASAITMLVETPWIRLGSIQGYQRVYNMLILGEWRSAHTLTVVVYYDYSSTAAETITFDLSTGYTAGALLQLEHYCGRPCQTIKVRISDSATTGESLRLSGVSFEIGQKYGANKIAPTKRA